MGLCYVTSKWLDRLWSEHLQSSRHSQDLVKQGVAKQGRDFAGFPSDLHARLYLQGDPQAQDSPPEWATKLHEMANQLAEWAHLRLMCSRNSFAAGIAGEVVLEALLPHVPQRPKDEPQSQQGQEEGGSGQGDGQGQPQQGQGAPSFTPEQEAQLRATLRKAARTAAKEVEQAEAELEGVETALGVSSPGTAVCKNNGPADLRRVREAHKLLEKSPRLKRIAELAGRLERVAAAKARSKVRPGVGEVHGVSMGDDVSRLLPSELVALRRPVFKRLLFAKLAEHRALCYEMHGKESQARGPIVVLLDESSSMSESEKDVWSKAVCLALLSTATKQKRAWHMVAFNGDVVREVSVEPGKATPANIQRALDHRCEGGTDFNPPVSRAIELVKTSKTMHQADVVIITDGESSLNPDVVAQAQQLTKQDGVSWFCVGVGYDAGGGLQSLASIATSSVRVNRTGEGDDIIAPVVNLNRGER